MLPIILLCGNAGSGKDYIADEMRNITNGTKVALADPLKQILLDLFDHVTFDDLWGPSQNRSTIIAINKKKILGRFWFLAHTDALSPAFSQIAYEIGSEDRVYKTFEHWLMNTWNAATIREYLQSLGNDWGRKSLNKDIWSNIGYRIARKLLMGGYRYDQKQGLLKDENSCSNLVIITDGRRRNEIINISQNGGKIIKIVSDKELVSNDISETELLKIPDYFYDFIITNKSDDFGSNQMGKRLAFLLERYILVNEARL